MEEEKFWKKYKVFKKVYDILSELKYDIINYNEYKCFSEPNLILKCPNNHLSDRPETLNAIKKRLKMYRKNSTKIK